MVELDVNQSLSGCFLPCAINKQSTVLETSCSLSRKWNILDWYWCCHLLGYRLKLVLLYHAGFQRAICSNTSSSDRQTFPVIFQQTLFSHGEHQTIKMSSGAHSLQQHGDSSFSHQQERQHFWSFASPSAACWAGCPRCLNSWSKLRLPSLPGRPSCPCPAHGQVQGQPRHSSGSSLQPRPPCEMHSPDLSSSITHNPSGQQLSTVLAQAGDATPRLALLTYPRHFSLIAECCRDTEVRKSA